VKTLLRVPDLVEAINTILPKPISGNFIFQLIADGKIKPFGYICSAPIFTPEQVGDVARNCNPAKKAANE